MDGGWNIRSGPGMDYSIIGYSSSGKRVVVYEKQGDWYCIGED